MTATLLKQSSWRAWSGAVLCALAINLGLFLLMPFLQRPGDGRPAPDPMAYQVQIVRLKRTEPPVAPKPVTPPRVEPRQRPDLAPRDHPLERPAWPFEIHPRLPGGPNTLALPALDGRAVQALGPPDLFSVGELDQPLVTLARMPPVYPLTAKRKGTEGWVNVRFVVDEQGKVDQVTITGAQPPGIFDDSVRRCVAGWRFKPGTVAGRPVRVWAETTVRFELD